MTHGAWLEGYVFFNEGQHLYDLGEIMWDQFLCNLSNPSEHVQMDTKSTEQMNSEGIQTAGLDEVFPPVVHVFLSSDMCVCFLEKIAWHEWHELCFSKCTKQSFRTFPQSWENLCPLWIPLWDSPMDSPWIPPKKSLISGATPVRYLYFHRKEADGVTFTELSKGQDADLEAPGQTRKPDGYRMGPPFDSVQLVNITPITMVYNYGLIYSNHN